MIRRLFFISFLFFGANSRAVETIRSYGFNPYRQLKYPATAENIDYVNGKAPKGGELRLATTEPFDCLNVMAWGLRAEDHPAPDMWLLMFDTLMDSSRDRDFSTYPLIAEQLEWAKDYSFVIFYLNPNARFNNGEPVTAEDVVFSYEYIRKTHYYYDQQIWKPVTGARAIDKHTVRFDIAPKDVAEGRYTISSLSAEILVLNKAFTLRHPREEWGRNGVIPVGSGPYVIKEFIPRNKVVYERNPNYWAKDLMIRKGQFNFDRIVYTVYTDISVARMAMRRGDLDLWTEGSLPKFLELKEELPAMHAEELKNPFFNKFFGIAFNSRRQLFSDRRVRKALELAYPFTTVNNMMFDGSYSSVRSIFNESEFAHEDAIGAREQKELDQLTDVPKRELNSPPLSEPGIASPYVRRRIKLKQAQDLFNEAGWFPKNGSMRKDGKPFEFTIVYYDRAFERWLLVYKYDLDLIGVNLQLSYVDSTHFESIIRSHNYDATSFDFSVSSVPETNSLESLFGSAYAFNSDNAASTGIVNPDLDRLIAHYDQADNLADKIEVARAIDRLVLAEHYYIPLGANEKMYVISNPWLHHQNPIAPKRTENPFMTWWAEQ